VRSFKKFKVFTLDKHLAGLLERKPGGSREGWQIAAVKQIGPRMAEYLDLIRSGQRSLRSELGKLLALSTVYGDAAVHAACEACLQAGVVGVENLELYLRRMNPAETAKLSPEPIAFQNQKLNRVVPTVDLRQYDALLFGSNLTHGAPEDDEDDGKSNDDEN